VTDLLQIDVMEVQNASGNNLKAGTNNVNNDIVDSVKTAAAADKLKVATPGTSQKQSEKKSGSKVLMGIYLQKGRIYVHLNKVIEAHGGEKSKISCAKIRLLTNKRKVFKHKLQVKHNTRDPVYDETIKVKKIILKKTLFLTLMPHVIFIFVYTMIFI